jgi:FixJ family two-component response regulator
MLEVEPIVFVIDDDEDVRSSLDNLFRSVGVKAALFASPTEFLAAKRPNVPSCLVLDVRFCGQERSGLDIQHDLVQADVRSPIVFITGHGDIQMTVQAMKSGAIDFLTKPFRDQDLLDAVHAGLQRDTQRLESEQTLSSIRTRFEALTSREREVFDLVAAGRLNKQAAAELGVSEVTVKVHRGHMMQKMGARSLAELVRMSDRLQNARAASGDPIGY